MVSSNHQTLKAQTLCCLPDGHNGQHDFQAHGYVHHNSILIKIQLDETVSRLIYFTAKSLYMFRVSQQPTSGVLKTVTAASGTGHNIGTGTSFQRGQVGTIWKRWEGSSCTDIMTCTGGCGYSF